MKKEINPKMAAIVIAVILVLIGVGVWFFTRPAATEYKSPTFMDNPNALPGTPAPPMPTQQ